MRNQATGDSTALAFGHNQLGLHVRSATGLTMTEAEKIELGTKFDNIQRKFKLLQGIINLRADRYQEVSEQNVQRIHLVDQTF